MMMIKSYSLKLGTLLVLMCAILFTACDEETVRDYKLSDEIKAMGGYADGSTWTYDVKVDRKIPLRHEFEIVDTLRPGDTIYTPAENVYEKDLVLRNLVVDFNHEFVDSIHLFGEFRTIVFDTAIFDTVSTRRKITPYGDDSVIFRTQYVVYDTLYSPEFEDVVTSEGIETEVFRYEMGNDEVSEERMKNTFTSSLNKNELIHDVFFASSNGSESFKRDIQPRTGYYTSYELKYIDNKLDDSMYGEGIGTYSYEVQDGLLVNGISYDNVQIIKSKYEIENYKGESEKREIEYWVVKGKGVIRIQENETSTTWTLKSFDIK